jgi:hypothetical protein
MRGPFAKMALARAKELPGSYIFFGTVIVAIGIVLVLFRTRMTVDYWQLFLRVRPSEGWIRFGRLGLLLMGLLLIVTGLVLAGSGIAQWF